MFLEPKQPLHLGFHPASDSDHTYQCCAICDCGKDYVETPEEDIRELKFRKLEVCKYYT